MKSKERIIGYIFTLLGLIAVGITIVITIYLLISGLPAIFKLGLDSFLFGRVWRSTGSNPQFGILPFILTTVYGSLAAIVLGVPLGFFTSVYLSKLASKRVKQLLEMVITLLSGIPSVVYGLVGMLVLVPFVKKVFNLSDGSCLLSAIIVLALMILPSVIKVSLDSLQAIPREYEEASLALGANEVETYFRITVPAAKSGIFASIVLGIGRAIGEAMAVMMVDGNVANMPRIFESVRFLTTAIASEMAYSSGVQREALFSISLVLFIFILIINLLLAAIKGESKHE